MLTTALLVAFAFVSAATIDFVEAQYVKAVMARERHKAALCSIIMYALGACGFFAALEYSMWLMIPECLGFYCGTLVALRKPCAAES